MILLYTSYNDFSNLQFVCTYKYAVTFSKERVDISRVEMTIIMIEIINLTVLFIIMHVQVDIVLIENTKHNM